MCLGDVKTSNIERSLKWLSLLCVLAVACVTFWTLDKGLGFTDDSWFLYLLRDRPTDRATNFQLLFGSVFGDNIYLYRLLAYSLFLVSSFVFGLGAYKFQQDFVKGYYVPLSAFVLAAMLGHPLARIAIDYPNLCVVVSEISWGFILLSFTQRKKWLFFFLAGFFAAFIIPIKITAGCLILLYLLVIIYYTSDKVNNVIFFLLGCLVTAVLYFLLIESPSDYFATFKSLVISTQNLGNRDYGTGFLFSWLKGAFAYFFWLFSIGFVVAYSTRYLKQGRVFVFVLIVISFVLYLLFSETVTFTGEKPNNPYIFIWLLASIYLSMCKDKKYLFLYLALIISPVCLSFGSDNMHRYLNVYISSLFMGVLLLADTRHKLCVNYVLSFVVAFLVLYVTCHYQNTQKEDIQSVGINQNLKVDSYTLSICQAVLPLVNPDEDCLCDMFSWGFAILLRQKPISSSFRIYTDDAKLALLRSVQENKTLNIFLADSEADFGLKKDLISFAKQLPGVEVISFGWENYHTLIRYSANQ